jgi:hypothetical protein
MPFALNAMTLRGLTLALWSRASYSLPLAGREPIPLAAAILHVDWLGGRTLEAWHSGQNYFVGGFHTIKEELGDLVEKKTWEIVSLPEGKKKWLDFRWVFNIKRNKEGEIDTKQD